ncbi:MAG: class II aldolase/adducin family protein, partial [Pseudolabrys sp.]
FGDTNMLVVKPEEGASLARALGQHWMVLMKRHGVTVAGNGVRECVFRSIFSANNAEFQVRAMTIGKIASLTAGETHLAGQLVTKTTGLTRSWEYWSMRVAKAGGLPLAGRKSRPAKPAAKRRRARKTARR